MASSYSCPTGLSGTSWKPSGACRLRAGICRHLWRLRKAESRAVRHRRTGSGSSLVEWQPPIVYAPGQAAAHSVSPRSPPCIEYFSLSPKPYLRIKPCLHIKPYICIKTVAALPFERANSPVAKSIRPRDFLNTWLRLYARGQTTPPIDEFLSTFTAPRPRTYQPFLRAFAGTSFA